VQRGQTALPSYADSRRKDRARELGASEDEDGRCEITELFHSRAGWPSRIPVSTLLSVILFFHDFGNAEESRANLEAGAVCREAVDFKMNLVLVRP
jgi:hypothetical protein